MIVTLGCGVAVDSGEAEGVGSAKPIGRRSRIRRRLRGGEHCVSVKAAVKEGVEDGVELGAKLKVAVGVLAGDGVWVKANGAVLRRGRAGGWSRVLRSGGGQSRREVRGRRWWLVCGFPRRFAWEKRSRNGPSDGLRPSASGLEVNVAVGVELNVLAVLVFVAVEVDVISWMSSSRKGSGSREKLLCLSPWR